MGDEEEFTYYYDDLTDEELSSIYESRRTVNRWYLPLIFALGYAAVIFIWLPFTAHNSALTVNGVIIWAFFEALAIVIALYADHRVQLAKQEVSTVISSRVETIPKATNSEAEPSLDD